MNVEVRPLKPEDLTAYGDFGAYAYNLPLARMNEYVQETATRPMYGAFADGQLAAALLDWRFDVELNGAMVRANGIGMVASAVETRRRGLVRDMLAGHLRQLREQGVVLSLLYPFAFSFYGRLGWAMAGRGVEVKFAPSELAAYGRQTGTVRRLVASEKDMLQLAEGESLESITAMLDGIYRDETRGLNLAARRDAAAWERILKVKRGRRYVFVWEDACGAAQGYVVAMVRAEDYPADLLIREVFARTPEAWRGLCFLLSCHDSNIRHIVITLPVEHPLPDLLDNPRVETSKLAPGVMARAVDVAALLAARGAAGCAAGECRINITDTLAPWNEGVWLVGFDGNGPVRVTREEAAAGGRGGACAPPDLEMDINGFSQLAVGYRPLAEMLKWGIVRGRPGPGLDFAGTLFPARQVRHLEFY